MENDTSLTVCHIPRLDSSQARIEMPHYLGLRSRLFGIHDLVSHLRRYGLQALVAPPPVRPSGPRCTSAGTAFRPSLYLSDNQLTSLHAGFGRVRCRWAPHHHPVAGGSWFVGHSSGTRENGCLSFRALRTERCPRFPAVFACITPRAACAIRIQPYRA